MFIGIDLDEKTITDGLNQSVRREGERECCLVQSVNVPVPDWHEPYGDRRQEIVFIGIDLDEKTITDGLNQSVRREGERECCLVQSVNVPVPDWHEPYGDRRQEIVFIGIDLDEDDHRWTQSISAERGSVASSNLSTSRSQIGMSRTVTGGRRSCS